MTSFFSSTGVRISFGLLAGSVVGWTAKDVSEKRLEKKKSNESLPSYDIQKKLATWNPYYKPQAWDNNWDNQEKVSLISKKILKLNKNIDINNNTTTPHEPIPKSELNTKSLSSPNSSTTNSSKVDSGKHSKSENSSKSYSQRKLGSRNIILIRHGQYNLNGKEDKERVLTELGKEQALAVGKRLAEISLPYTSILSSTMTRAIETTNHVAGCIPNVPISRSDLIREGLPFPPEPGLNIKDRDLGDYKEALRIESAFRNIFHRANQDQVDDSYEIVICHANVIRYFVCRALQIPPEAWLRMSLHHASITWLTIRPSGRVSLRMLGDSGFLPPEKMTTS